MIAISVEQILFLFNFKILQNPIITVEHTQIETVFAQFKGL